MVNQQVLEGQWNEVKGKLRSHWAALSDDDLENFNGNVDRLVGIIQQKTGESRDAIESYLEEVIAESGDATQAAAQSAREYSRYAAEQAQHAARDVGDRFQAAAHQVSDSWRDGYAEAEHLVRQRPMESLAVCFGAGLIAGVVVGMVIRR
ncbi:MAG: CsbD family protein [Planctomycetes bacterium]|nr:CsbD family protein [Planctomycetota bacterium]